MILYAVGPHDMWQDSKKTGLIYAEDEGLLSSST